MGYRKGGRGEVGLVGSGYGKVGRAGVGSGDGGTGRWVGVRWGLGIGVREGG